MISSTSVSLLAEYSDLPTSATTTIFRGYINNVGYTLSLLTFLILIAILGLCFGCLIKIIKKLKQ